MFDFSYGALPVVPSPIVAGPVRQGRLVARHGSLWPGGRGPHRHRTRWGWPLADGGRGAGQSVHTLSGVGRAGPGAQWPGPAMVGRLQLPRGRGLQACRRVDSAGGAPPPGARAALSPGRRCAQSHARAQAGRGARRGRRTAAALAAGLGPRRGRGRCACYGCTAGSARAIPVPALHRGAGARHCAANATGGRGLLPQSHWRLGQAPADPHAARPGAGRVRPRQ